MAQELNRQELIKQLGKFTGFRGAQAFEVGELLTPVINLGDLDKPPFHAQVGGMGSQVTVPVAAQFSFAGFQCVPVGPLETNKNQRSVVKYVLVSCAAATEVQLGLVVESDLTGPAINLAFATDLGNWDSAWGTELLRNASRIGVVASATDYLNAINRRTLRQYCGALATVRFDGPFNVAPGWNLIVQARTVNVGITTSYFWDEFVLG